MLLIMDRRIPGIVRERMIISYYRYKGAVVISNIDEVVKLCRMTGFTLDGKRPKDYPEEYFARFSIDKDVIEMIISRLRSDDIYNHTSSFPNPLHRSTALSVQSSMLYVIMYFAPSLLHNSTSVMREIVDKYFSDNYMVAMYMGFVVDLADAWEPYKAARQALKNTLQSDCIADHLKRHAELVPKLHQGLEKYLTQGVLTDDYLTENLRKVVEHIRSCNVTLRWFILHRATSHDEKLRKLIKDAVPQNELVKLIMNVSQLEFIVKDMLRKLLDSKVSRYFYF
jgi:WASH complex subunit strumpellin